MKKNSSLIWLLSLIVFLNWLILSTAAVFHYPGQSIYFITFCVVSLIMFGLGWTKRISYFYIFLSTFWMLGFWLKTVLHLIIGYAFVEPIGDFDWSSHSWDISIKVAIVACGTLALSRCIFLLICKNDVHKEIEQAISQHAPVWYKHTNKLVWSITFISIVLVVTANYILHLHQVGVIPQHHLPLRLNAINAFMLNVGFAFWLGTLIWWDIKLGKKILPRLIAAIFSGCFISLSVLSRGLYIYQIGQYLLPFFLLYKPIHITWKQISIFILLLLAGLFVTLKLVMEQRDNYYPSYQGYNKKYNFSNAFFEKSADVSSSGKGNIFLKLVADRWIGIEGVLAVSSWPHLGSDLFYKGWGQKLKNEPTPLYSKICNVIYEREDYPGKNKFSFASLPGLAAMLYYSGSLMVVFVGILFLTLILLISELLLAHLLANPFVISFYGIYLAVIISMFNNAYLGLIQFFEIWLGFLILWFLQKKLDSVLETLRLRKKLITST